MNVHSHVLTVQRRAHLVQFRAIFQLSLWKCCLPQIGQYFAIVDWLQYCASRLPVFILFVYLFIYLFYFLLLGSGVEHLKALKILEIRVCTISGQLNSSSLEICRIVCDTMNYTWPARRGLLGHIPKLHTLEFQAALHFGMVSLIVTEFDFDFSPFSCPC